MKNDKISSPVFSLWIISLIISSIYTYVWDIKMDWGLMEVNNSSSGSGASCGNGCMAGISVGGGSNGCARDYLLLREEIVYPSPSYYYLAYVEDFFGRTMWAFTISLNHVGNIDADWLTTIAAMFELFRRFVWNFFRLENEHLNNCGEFRAVRDISIAPLPHQNPSDGGDGKSSMMGGGGGVRKNKKRAKLRRNIQQYSINNINNNNHSNSLSQQQRNNRSKQ